MWILKLKTFIKSLTFHIYSGLPKSTVDEIRYRYNICINCDQFNKEKSICEVCGCNLSTKSKFLNKLAWADQECPIGKWPKIIR
jgi:uncharacterized paraquat-inducible protein A